MDNAFRSHGIYYGLFFRTALRPVTWPVPQPLAMDWGMIAYALLEGCIARVDRGLFVSASGGMSESQGRISNFQYSFPDVVFPFQRYARWVLRGLRGCDEMTVIEKMLIARELWRLNWQFKFRSD
ncbi:hypothetical protein OAJ78_06490 [Gammaproteobacteria bacterium]|nr:hypothetical protein [Gammaproteobacteria bacterium]